MFHDTFVHLWWALGLMTQGRLLRKSVGSGGIRGCYYVESESMTSNRSWESGKKQVFFSNKRRDWWIFEDFWRIFPIETDTLSKFLRIFQLGWVSVSILSFFFNECMLPTTTLAVGGEPVRASTMSHAVLVRLVQHPNYVSAQDFSYPCHTNSSSWRACNF